MMHDDDRTYRAWEVVRELTPTPRAIARRRRGRIVRGVTWIIATVLCAVLALRAVNAATPTSGPAWLTLIEIVIILTLTFCATRSR